MRMGAQQLKRKLVDSTSRALQPPAKQQVRREETTPAKMQRQRMLDNLEMQAKSTRSDGESVLIPRDLQYMAGNEFGRAWQNEKYFWFSYETGRRGEHHLGPDLPLS